MKLEKYAEEEENKKKGNVHDLAPWTLSGGD